VGPLMSWSRLSPRRAVVIATAAAVCLLSCDSAWASCPAATEASPGFRSFVPDCRAYELVSPPYEGGWPVLWSFGNPPPISSNGERILGIDFAGFAGTENDEQEGLVGGAVYEFSRTPSGWTTAALDPPASLVARREFVTGSADLSRTLWKLAVQRTEGEEVASAENYMYAIREVAPRAGPSFKTLGPEDSLEGPGQHDFSFAGASRDLTHVLFSVTSKEHQLWPGDTTHPKASSLYEYVGTGNREPTLVGVRDEGPLEGATNRNEHAELVSACGTVLGSSREASAYNAISADGAIVYFTALHGESAGCPPVNELYARVDGAQTVAISEPALPVGACTAGEPCMGAAMQQGVFQGASEDGSRVFFTSEQPLVDGAPAEGIKLYEAEIRGGRVVGMTDVSADPTPGRAPETVGVARISQDGSHVYFVARGMLTARPNANGEAAEVGGYNLYLHDTVTGRTSFVAALLTGREDRELQEGFGDELQALCEAENPEPGEPREECEAAIPAAVTEKVAEAVAEKVESRESGSGLSVRDERPFQTTPDGRFLIFESPRRLTGSEDTSTVGQLFEYDAQTEALARVSIGQFGYNDNGNTTVAEYAPAIAVPEYAVTTRPTEAASRLSLSEDGRVFFTSRDALTPQAIEGRENVYEYGDGEVSLISPGDEAAPLQTGQSRLLGVDESGGDVFFFTTDSLVPQDTDTQASWYDARAAGGFPAPPSTPDCSEGACQGPLGAAPPLPVPGGSATTAAEGELAPPASTLARRPKAKEKKHGKGKPKSTRTRRARKQSRGIRSKASRTTAVGATKEPLRSAGTRR
jgi:hypothetical protein